MSNIDNDILNLLLIHFSLSDCDFFSGVYCLLAKKKPGAATRAEEGNGNLKAPQMEYGHQHGEILSTGIFWYISASTSWVVDRKGCFAVLLFCGVLCVEFERLHVVCHGFHRVPQVWVTLNRKETTVLR